MLVSSLPRKWPLVLPVCYGYLLGHRTLLLPSFRLLSDGNYYLSGSCWVHSFVSCSCAQRALMSVVLGGWVGGWVGAHLVVVFWRHRLLWVAIAFLQFLGGSSSQSLLCSRWGLSYSG